MSIKLTPYQRVQIARDPKRPYTMDYIKVLFSDFIELHGDRVFGDDMAVVCGLTTLENEPLMVIGQEKGRTLEEKMARNFGSMHPEGYRKALRCMKLAEKFKLPVVTFIDTSGAYPGIGAEERGQAEAIARNLREMSLIESPIISIVIGEGGSGGALGIGVSDKLIMLENAYYSVISPEGCAAILFHDSSKAEEACSALKLTAEDLLKLGVADEIIPEINLNSNIEETAKKLKESILRHLSYLKKMSVKKLLDLRYKKYRKIGKFLEKRRKK